MFKVEFSISEQQPVYYHLHKRQLNDIPVLKLYSILVLAHSLNGVHTKLNFWLDFAVGSVATALHEVSRNGRVMANLLDPDRAAVDPTLESLP